MEQLSRPAQSGSARFDWHNEFLMEKFATE